MSIYRCLRMCRCSWSSLFARFGLAGFRPYADPRVILQSLLGQSLGGFFKGVARLRHIEPFGQDFMGLQAGVFAEELGMKFAGRTHQQTVPRFWASGQYENQLPEQVGRLASEHRLLEKRRLSLQRLENPLKGMWKLGFRFYGKCARHKPCEGNLEARGGIEPPIKVLQTFALPLGDRASGAGCRRGDEPAKFMTQTHSTR